MNAVECRSPAPVIRSSQRQRRTAASRLLAAQEDLKKVMEEKERIVEELRDAKEMIAEVVSEKRRLEAALEIEQFRIVELEQTAIETAQRREEEWQRKLEEVMTELSKNVDAKDAAMRHAEEATEIAEINAAETRRLKSEVEAVTEEVARSTALIQRLETAVAFAEKLSGDWRKKAEDLGAEILRLRAQIELLEEEVAELRSLADTWKRRHRDLEAASSERNELARELEGIRMEGDEAKQAAEELAAAMREAKERVLAKQAELERAEKAMAELRRKMEMLEGVIRASDEGKKRKEMGEKAEMAVLRSEVAKLEEEKAAAERKLRKMEAEKTEANLEAQMERLRWKEMAKEMESELRSLRARETAPQIVGKKSRVLLKLICSPVVASVTDEEEVMMLPDVKIEELYDYGENGDDERGGEGAMCEPGDDMVAESHICAESGDEDRENGEYDGFCDRSEAGKTTTANRRSKKKYLMEKFGSLLKKAQCTSTFQTEA